MSQVPLYHCVVWPPEKIEKKSHPSGSPSSVIVDPHITVTVSYGSRFFARSSLIFLFYISKVQFCHCLLQWRVLILGTGSSHDILQASICCPVHAIAPHFPLGGHHVGDLALVPATPAHGQGSGIA